MKPLLLLTLSLALISCSKNEISDKPKTHENNLLVRSGTESGNGGDSQLIRKKIQDRKRQDLEKSLTSVFANNTGGVGIRNMLAYFGSVDVGLRDLEANNILKQMQNAGLHQDIFDTNFEIKESCKDYKGIERAASTLMNVKKSAICINVRKIAKDFGPYIQDSDLISLMLHEFAHHFGFEDEDHEFASSIADDYQKDSEDKNQDGEPLNYLVK